MDVILLVISLYGLYNFTEQKESLMTQMLEGESLDPFFVYLFFAVYHQCQSGSAAHPAAFD